MSYYTQYRKHHVDLLKEFYAACQQELPFVEETINNEVDTQFMANLKQLCESDGCPNMNEQGQWLVSRVVSAYSHLMPLLSRDLLWFFGGDCLHYMPDDEISFYQQLDELRFAAEEAGKYFDYEEAKGVLKTRN